MSREAREVINWYDKSKLFLNEDDWPRIQSYNYKPQNKNSLILQQQLHIGQNQNKEDPMYGFLIFQVQTDFIQSDYGYKWCDDLDCYHHQDTCYSHTLFVPCIWEDWLLVKMDHWLSMTNSPMWNMDILSKQFWFLTVYHKNAMRTISSFFFHDIIKDMIQSYMSVFYNI